MSPAVPEAEYFVFLVAPSQLQAYERHCCHLGKWTGRGGSASGLESEGESAPPMTQGGDTSPLRERRVPNSAAGRNQEDLLSQKKTCTRRIFARLAQGNVGTGKRKCSRDLGPPVPLEGANAVWVWLWVLHSSTMAAERETKKDRRRLAPQ